MATLESSKLGLENPEFSLAELIQAASRSVALHGKHPQPGSITVLTDSALPDKLVGDAVRIRQVIESLLTIAIACTPSGELQVSVFPSGHSKDDVEITIEMREATQHSSPQDASRSASAFESPANRSLLHDVRRASHSLGGDLGVSRERAAGDVLWCRLPLQRPLTACQPSTRSVDPPSSPGDPSKSSTSLRILMAEDNPINQRVGKLILQRAGYRIDLVGDGSEALEAHCTRPYDLILMDCQMPTMDGFEATRRIRASSSRQPVIIAVTANALVGERERCLDAGMDDYLSKPFQADQLVAIVGKWVETAVRR